MGFSGKWGEERKYCFMGCEKYARSVGEIYNTLNPVCGVELGRPPTSYMFVYVYVHAYVFVYVFCNVFAYVYVYVCV